ncbi:uncharacterized protein LOC127845883 [Dreissena polymorpha]|uniref:uncharacterized protein LOC127845883 n=1 Tax=Dreissena polymorpha TaxID=45954 RepID=UPI002264E909|nr:uncharacterized protein LOC127845883 [Dreissena polymorpha]
MDSEEGDSDQTPILNNMDSSVNLSSNSISLLREGESVKEKALNADADAPQEVRAGDETHSRLKFFIRLLIYSPLKFKLGSLWISLPHFFLLVAHVLKLVLITILVFKVGECRARLSAVVLHGQTALRHILLLQWDASYETLPYPPSIGVFAAYDIDDFKSRINYGVAQIQLSGSTKRMFNDLSYLRRWWIVPSIIGDAFAIAGTSNIIQEFTKQLQTFDKMAVHIGYGCLLAWICVMRYLKVHVKVSLLFHILYYAKWNVLAFLVCASILFVGYLFCAYVALGVYHFKFQNIGMSADALFALTQGDDVFATFSGMSKNAVGDPGYVQTSLRILACSFIILFTIIILNLLIALFNSAYEIIMKKENGEVLNSNITRFERVFYRYISLTENGDMKEFGEFASTA